MKRKVLSFLLVFCFLGCTLKANEKKEFASFFEGKEFLTEPHNMGGKRMLFSYVLSGKGNDIVYKGILYEKTAAGIKKYLTFDRNIISNASQKIFTGTMNNQIYYGWRIRFVEVNNCIQADYITNDGKNITDGPTILYDTSLGQYKLYVQDRSQW